MTTLKVGDKAPSIDGLDQNGSQVSWKDYQGKKVVLYFYPKDMTPGCTVESCNLRDHYDELKEKGYEVIGVSADNQEKHKSFIEKHELPFKLIADVEKKVIKAYGVWGPKKFMGRTYDGIHRTTFIIDKEGMISKIIDKVKTKDHAAQIFDAQQMNI